MTELGRTTTLEGLVPILKRRRATLGLSQLALDDISGLQTGYTGKIECGDKGLGKLSLPLALGGLGLELAVVRASSTQPAKTRPHEDFFRQRARKAAAARWAKTTPKQRRKIMRGVAKARHAKALKAERERV